MQSIIDCFLAWWLRSGRYRWSWLHRRLFECHYLTTVLPTVNSLEEIEACQRQVMRVKIFLVEGLTSMVVYGLDKGVLNETTITTYLFHRQDP